MKKFKALLVMGVAAMTIASCSNDMELKSASQGTTPIQLSTYIGNQSTTRVVTNAAYSGSGTYTFNLQDNQFLSSIGNTFNLSWLSAIDNNIGVYFKDNAEQNPIQYTNPYKYRCLGNGGLRGSEVYYPTSGSTIDIYAVYPNNDKVVNSQNTATEDANYYGNSGLPNDIPTALNFTVQTDQTNHLNYCSSDFMYAKLANQNVNGSPVTLGFKHMLSKIRVNLNVSDETMKSRLNNANLLLTNVKKTTTLNVMTGEMTNPTSDGNVKIMYFSGNAEYDLSNDANNDNTPDEIFGLGIIVPQTIPANTKFITIELSNGDTYSYTVPEGGLTFESGKMYTFNINLDIPGTLIQLTSSIINASDWTTTTTPTGGNAEKE